MLRPPGSRGRDCHFTDISSPSLLIHLLKVEGGCSRMTVSSTAVARPHTATGAPRPTRAARPRMTITHRTGCLVASRLLGPGRLQPGQRIGPAQEVGTALQRTSGRLHALSPLRRREAVVILLDATAARRDENAAAACQARSSTSRKPSPGSSASSPRWTTARFSLTQPPVATRSSTHSPMTPTVRCRCSARADLT